MRTKPKCPRLAVGLARPTLAPRTKGGHCTVVRPHGNYRTTSTAPGTDGRPPAHGSPARRTFPNGRAAAILGRIRRVFAVELIIFAVQTTERSPARVPNSGDEVGSTAPCTRTHGRRNATRARTHSFRPRPRERPGHNWFAARRPRDPAEREPAGGAPKLESIIILPC